MTYTDKEHNALADNFIDALVIYNSMKDSPNSNLFKEFFENELVRNAELLNISFAERGEDLINIEDYR